MRAACFALALSLAAGLAVSAVAQSAEDTAFSAREVLRTCRDPLFVDCFRKWQPPKPQPDTGAATGQVPPGDAPAEGDDTGDGASGMGASGAAGGSASAGPGKPGKPTRPPFRPPEDDDQDPEEEAAAVPPPSAPKPPPRPPGPPPGIAASDMAAYEALMKAIRDAGLEQRLRVENPPQDSSVILKVAPAPATPAPPLRPAAPVPPGKR